MSYIDQRELDVLGLTEADIGAAVGRSGPGPMMSRARRREAVSAIFRAGVGLDEPERRRVTSAMYRELVGLDEPAPPAPPSPPPQAPPSPPQAAVPANLFTMPVEMLFNILANLDPASLINLATAAPLRFLSFGLNIYVEDAHFQVRLQDAPPMEESEATRPLLLWAIDNGIDANVIEQIMTAYQQVPGQWANSIWGPLSRAIPTLLHAAIQAVRPDIVDLLLERGANPRVRYCSIGGCIRSGYPHPECTAGPPGRVIDCYNALQFALEALSRSTGANEAAARAIVRRLLASGESVDLLLGNAGLPGNAGNLSRDAWMLVQVGLSDVVIPMIDDVLNLPDTDPRGGQLRNRLDFILHAVVTFATIPDGQDALIEYLIGLGASTTRYEDLFVASMRLRRRLNTAAIVRARLAKFNPIP